LIILSILLATVVNRKMPGINAFRTLFFIPVISGSIAVGIAWRLMLDTNGIINSILISLGILERPIQWLAEPGLTLPIAMLLTIWLGMGYYMMIFLAGLQNIPEDLYDAAQIDGCNNFQKHWYVSLPGLRPQITFVAVISSLAALQVFNEIYILTGGLGGILNSGVTMVFYLWRKAFTLNQAGVASAIAMVLLVITLAFSIFNIRLLERGSEVET
jgi:putative chitobiose transport system permease protein